MVRWSPGERFFLCNPARDGEVVPVGKGTSCAILSTEFKPKNNGSVSLSSDLHMYHGGCGCITCEHAWEWAHTVAIIVIITIIAAITTATRRHIERGTVS